MTQTLGWDHYWWSPKTELVVCGQMYNQEHVGVFFFTFVGWCSVNSLIRVRPLTPSPTMKLWDVYGATFGTNDWNCGMMATGFLDMTTSLFTACWERASFTSSITQSLLTTPLLTIFGSLLFLSVPQNEREADGLLFWHYGGDPVHIGDEAWHAYKTAFRECSKPAMMLEAVCCCTIGWLLFCF